MAPSAAICSSMQPSSTRGGERTILGIRVSSNHSKNNHVPFASTDNDVSKRSSHRPDVHRRYDLDQISNFLGMSSTMRDARQRRVRARMFAADAPPTPGAAVEYRLPTSARPELPQGRPGLRTMPISRLPYEATTAHASDTHRDAREAISRATQATPLVHNAPHLPHPWWRSQRRRQQRLERVCGGS